jgi:hypothetical protein
MQRREFLTSIPAVALVGAVPVTAVAEETPVARLFAAWKVAHDRANAGELSDEDEWDCINVELELEKQMMAAPSLTPADVARKFLVASGFGDFSVAPETDATLWAEMEALAGV